MKNTGPVTSSVAGPVIFNFICMVLPAEISGGKNRVIKFSLTHPNHAHSLRKIQRYAGGHFSALQPACHPLDEIKDILDAVTVGIKQGREGTKRSADLFEIEAGHIHGRQSVVVDPSIF